MSGLSGFISILIGSFGLIEAAAYPLAFRAVTFEVSFPGKRFAGSDNSTMKLVTRPFCAFECTKLPQCRSFNVCAFKRCELNKDDHFSTVSGLTLTNDDNCQYFAMLRGFIPECRENVEINSTNSSTQNATQPGVCDINLKKVDQESGHD